MLAHLIRADQPVETGAMSRYPWSKKAERQYRFVSRFGEEVLLHKVSDDGNSIWLPRGLCPIGQIDNRVDGLDVVFPKAPTPRPHQVELFGEVEAFLSAGKSGVVSAYTGFGKTVVGYWCAYVAQKKTLVVTTKEDIYQQWIDGAKKFLGLKWADVGEIRQDKCEVVGTKFVVAMVHSLTIDGKYPDWIFDEFGLVIFDECHRMAADQFKAATEIIPAKLRVGLTATLERQDGKEELVTAHLGPVRARTRAQLMVPKVLRFHTNWQCPRVLDKSTGKVKRINHSPGKSTHVEKMLAADPTRNHLICQLVQDAHAKGRKVVVFSKFIDHLKTIHRGLTKIGVSGKDIGFYIGVGTKAEAKVRDQQKGRDILLTTYSMMGEGTDIPWLSCMIMGIPISNSEQAIGRIRREYPDKPEPVVMDLLDNDSPLFNAYAGKRLQFYKRIKAKVIDF